MDPLRIGGSGLQPTSPFCPFLRVVGSSGVRRPRRAAGQPRTGKASNGSSSHSASRLLSNPYGAQTIGKPLARSTDLWGESVQLQTSSRYRSSHAERKARCRRHAQPTCGNWLIAERRCCAKAFGMRAVPPASALSREKRDCVEAGTNGQGRNSATECAQETATRV
jgi:hypothetical protein